MSKQVEFLLFGQYSDNRGDEAAARALIYGIKDIEPEAYINIFYLDKNFAPVIGENLFIRNHFKHGRGAGVFMLKLLLRWLLDKSRITSNFCFREAGELLGLIKRGDVFLLSPGGPYIGDMYDFRSEAIRLLALLVACSYGKKTMIYGPSMGPFKKWLRNIYRVPILNLTDMIVVRDSVSFEHLRGLRLKNKNAFLSTDCAMQRDIVFVDEVYKRFLRGQGFRREDKIVGITHVDLSWHPYWSRKKGLQENLDHCIASVADYLIEQYGYRVVFVQQIYGSYDDSACIKRVLTHMKFATQAVILDPVYDSDEQQVLFSKFALFIGCRHHSVILATKMMVPTICVAYEFKIESYMRDMRLENYMISVDQMTPKVMEEFCERIETHQLEYLDTLRKGLVMQKELSRTYAEKLKVLLAS